MKKRILSLLLVAVMMFTMMPITATAVEESEITTLEIDTEYTAEISEVGGAAYFAFTPEVSDGYLFSSYAEEIDTCGVLYDSEWNELVYNDDHIGLNFGVAFYLEAGQTYYFEAAFLNGNETGSFPVKISISHEYESEIITEATCTTEGSIEFTCVHCGYTYTEIYYGNHDYVEKIIVEGTCVDYGTKSYICTVCGDSETYSFKGNHSYNDDGICTVCGEESPYPVLTIGSEQVVTYDDYQERYLLIPEVSEYYLISSSSDESGWCDIWSTAWEEIAYNTLEEGVEAYLEAGNTYYVDIIFWGDYPGELPITVSIIHEYNEEIITEATCTEEGTVEYTCIHCGDSYTDKYLEPHSYVDGACEVCGAGYPELELDTEYSAPIVIAGEAYYTFTAEVTDMYEFKVSGDDIYSFTSILNNYGNECDYREGYEYSFILYIAAGETYTFIIGCIDARSTNTDITVEISTSHSYYWESIEEATCTEEGIREWTCYYCGHSYTETYLAYHNYDVEITGEATCVEQAVYTYTCVDCGDSFEERYYGEHKFEPEIVEQATCTESGVKKYTCALCDSWYEEEYYEPHSYDDDGVCATCGDVAPYPILKLDTEYEVDILNDGEVTYMFIPETTDYYGFFAESDYICSYFHVFDKDWNGIHYNDGYRYGAGTVYEAGETYYFVVGYHWADDIDTVTVTLTLEHYYEEEIITEATCTEEGTIEYTCRYCGDTYTETKTLAHSYVDGECEVCGAGYPEIELDTEYVASPAYFTFTPEISHWYLFESFGEFDTYATLYDSDWNEIAYSDDYEDLNFHIEVYLEAGETYYFESSSYGYGGGSYPVAMLTMLHDYDYEITSEGTCVVPGIVIYTCCDCDYSYTEEVYGDCEYECEITVKATCSVAGIRTYTCIHCGDSHEEEYYESHSYDENGICTVCDYEAPYPIIELDVEYDTVVEAGNIAYYIFIPSESDVYLFGSYTNGDDTQGAIGDAYGNIIAFNDDYFMGDFGVEAYLESGETYYLMVAYYSEEDSGTVPVMITKIHEYESEVITEATCYVDGLNKETCVHCGETREVKVPKAHEYDYETGLCTKCGGYPSGICGDNLTWTLIDGVLTISGTGDMYDYTLDEIETAAPWVLFYELIDTVVIEDGATSIGMLAFAMCANVTSVEIPDSVTSIGAGAFGMCASLESVTIPEGVTEIGMQTFYGCQSLTEVVIPDSVTTIGYAAFAGCYDLTSVTFEGDAPTFGEECFYDVTATVYYPADNNTWTEEVMLDYGGDLTWVEYESAEIDVLYGDVNLDGEVTAVDAAMAYSYVNGKIDLTDEQFVAGDVNGDGEITAVDAAMIYSYVNGKIDKFPVEG